MLLFLIRFVAKEGIVKHLGKLERNTHFPNYKLKGQNYESIDQSHQGKLLSCLICFEVNS